MTEQLLKCIERRFYFSRTRFLNVLNNSKFAGHGRGKEGYSTGGAEQREYHTIQTGPWLAR